MHNFFRVGIIFILLIGFTACETTQTYAPVIDATQIEPLPKSGLYRVSANDTLYSIAWRFGLDYRDLAIRNHILPPYHIEKGQFIYLATEAPLKKIPPLSEIKSLKPSLTPTLVMRPPP